MSAPFFFSLSSLYTKVKTKNSDNRNTDYLTLVLFKSVNGFKIVQIQLFPEIL